MIQIHFVTDLGARVTVDVDAPEQLLDVQRRYGRLGWTSGDVPAGGYQFPLENEADFDWCLLGARRFTTDDGDAVYCRGYVYKRRELEAVDSKKLRLPKAVKYSRGARPTDPEHLREKADGEIEYVTLAVFRGGKRQERYASPQAARQGAVAAPTPPQRQAPPARTPAPAPQRAARPVPHLSDGVQEADFADLPGIPDGEEGRDTITEQLLDQLGKTGLSRTAYKRDILDKLSWTDLQARHQQARLLPG